MAHVTADNLRLDREPARPVARPPWRIVGAFGWSIAGALTAAAAWAAVMALYRVPSLPPANDVLLTALGDRPRAVLIGQLASIGAAAGLVFGAVAGGLFGTTGRVPAFLRWGVSWAAHAALAAGAGPLFAAATADWLSPLAGFGLSCVVLGGLAGLAVYTWGRRPVALDPTDWPAEPAPAAGPISVGFLARLSPIVVVSIACLVAVIVTPPGPAGRAILAIGLVGLAVVWGPGRPGGSHPRLGTAARGAIGR
jgi:hypothetical protein